MVAMFLQGTTHFDGVGHAWYGDRSGTGTRPTRRSTTSSKGSVLAVAQKGVVGRATLVDIARFKGKDALERGEAFTFDDVLAAAESQGTTVEPHDILLLRTGWLSRFYADRAAFYQEPFKEPGLLYDDRVPHGSTRTRSRPSGPTRSRTSSSHSQTTR